MKRLLSLLSLIAITFFMVGCDYGFIKNISSTKQNKTVATTLKRLTATKTAGRTTITTKTAGRTTTLSSTTGNIVVTIDASTDENQYIVDFTIESQADLINLILNLQSLFDNPQGDYILNSIECDDVIYDYNTIMNFSPRKSCTLKCNWEYSPQVNPDEPELKITYFNGPYGSDWIENMASRFEEKYDVKVQLIPSNEGNCSAENYIRSGYNVSDIYIGEYIPWKSLVQGGYLTDLSDVYEAEVETKNGKQKIKDFLDDNASEYFYSQRQLKTQEYTPWAMPWSVKPNALAYNEDILLSIKHVSTIEVTKGCVSDDTEKWIGVPKTMNDLYAFCEDVIAFNDNSAEKQALNDTHTYTPIGWAGSYNLDSIGFFIITWWAEAQGLTTSNYANEGSFYDFYNFGNTTESNVGQELDLGVWNQTGLKLAYDTFAELFFDAQGNYRNTLNNPYNNTSQVLQQLFVANKVNEKPILITASSYLENEANKNRYLDSDKDGIQDVNFKFMNIPSLYEDSDNYLYCSLSDSIIVPKKANNIDLAKQFLIFMCNEEEIDNFTKETNGGIRPFKCDVRTSVTGNEYSAFVNSLFEVYYNSVKFVEYPMNATSLAQVSHVYRYENPTYIGNVGWSQILDLMKTPGAGLTPGVAITTAVVSHIELDAWVRKYKLTNKTKE